MRVYHPQLGNGTVIRERHGVFELLVKFDSGLETWVRRTEVQPVDSKRIIEKVVTSEPTPSGPTASESVIRSKCILESLRLGIVPSEGLGTFTFGRAKSIGEAINWLQDDKKGALVVLGDYGAGKTHFFEYMREYCVSKGYATSYVEVDPNESPLSRPKLIYNHIVKSITFREGEEFGNFRDLMRRFALKSSGHFAHPYLDIVVEGIREQYDDDLVWEWIEGERVSYYPRPMYDHSTAANLYCNLISAIGAVCLSLGLPGFVVILDEAEQLASVWYTYQFLRGFNMLKGLSLLTANSRNLLTEGLGWSRENGDVVETLQGRETGLIYSGLLKPRIPYTARIPSGVKVMVGLTNSTSTDYLVPGISGVGVSLEPLTRFEKSSVLQAIYQIYAQAYPAFDGTKHINGLIAFVVNKFGDNVRTMIKSFIEALDLLRLGKTTGLNELRT